jgi:hypothetical protein
MHVCTLHKLENVYLMHLEGIRWTETWRELESTMKLITMNLSKAKLFLLFLSGLWAEWRVAINVRANDTLMRNKWRSQIVDH